MKRLRAYKTELDPNNAQRTLFRQCCGAARFTFNWALNDRVTRFKAGEKTSLYEQKRRFNALKGEQFPWLADVPYRIVESAFANLDRAYQNFFRRVRSGEKRPGFPRFKSRKKGLGNFTVRQSIHVEEQRIKLPRLGWLRLKEHGYLPTDDVKILSATISEQADRWFISLQVEEDAAEPRHGSAQPIGVDLGIKTLATCSDGTVFENPRTLKRYTVKLRRAQRELSRRKKGGKNRNKSRQRVARLHAKIANVRKHALHQVSYYLTAKTKPSVVVIEDLNVAGMLKNRRLSKAIADASFAELRRQVEYKGQWHGVDIVVAGRFYPSSKTCSSCGVVKPLLQLSERTFVCEACGVTIDRDLNAAYNLASLAAKRAVTASGGAVRPADGGQAPMKEKPGAARPISPGRH